MKRAFFALVVLLAATVVSRGQWGPAGCAQFGRVVHQTASSVQPKSKSTYSWEADPKSDWWFLWLEDFQLGTLQVGAYHPEKGYYRVESHDPFEFSEEATWEAPIDFPVERIAENFGLDLSHIGGGPEYTINGKECTREKAVESLEQTLVDDSLKPRLLLIGSKEDTTRVTDAIKGSSELKENLRGVIIQEYEPDHWHVQGVGYKTDGEPTIYFLKPSAGQPGKAKVLVRQDEFKGVEQFEALTRQALRKPDPDYDPKKDPKYKPPAAPFNVDLSSVPLPVWVLGGIAALMFLSRPRRKE